MELSLANTLLSVLTYTLIPVSATVIGGIIAAWRLPSPTVRSLIQHFAAGVVFAAAAGELLPDVVHEKSPIAVILGGTIGVILMLGVKALTKKSEGSMSLITTVGVDVLIDGLIIGIGFAAGAKEGILLTIALTIELLFLSLSVSANLSKGNATPRRLIMITLLMALLLPTGASVGVVLLGRLSGAALATFLATGLVALLYLVTEELLVEAHKIPDTPLSTAIFFVGFLLLIAIEEVVKQ